ncbi:phosphate ABC transporter substrate-binding protein PstS family protein [Corticicoccus populi]|uniref:Phosphate-binding protein n=1 Tax=Corticicoccus populi TaxID=1812821 RepID=A0ABW5WRL1_9STAP
MKKLFLGTFLMSFMFILAACGSGNAQDPTEENAEAGGNSSVRGEGSSTVFPILNLLVEDFYAEEGTAVELGGNGTGSGFSNLTEGSADFANASRAIADEEIAALDDAGIEWTEFLVATDGLTIAVNQANDFIDYLTFEELKKIYSGEAENWSDVRDEFPDEPITAYGPDQSHGTHDFFNEEVMAEEGVQGELIQDTNQVVSSVVGDENSIGFFGFNFYIENEDQLKAVPVSLSEDEDAVEPTFENVMDFSYPLSRPLYVYASNQSLEEKETFRSFMEFVLNHSQAAAEESGYVPLEDDALQEQLSKLP